MKDILVFTHLDIHLAKLSDQMPSDYLDILCISEWKRACYLILNYSSINDQVKDIEAHCRYLPHSQLVIFDANYGAPNNAKFNEGALSHILRNLEIELKKDSNKNFIFHMVADNEQCFAAVKEFISTYIQQYSTEIWFTGFNIAIMLNGQFESLKFYGKLLDTKFKSARQNVVVDVPVVGSECVDVAVGVAERIDAETQTIENVLGFDAAVQVVEMVDAAVQVAEALLERQDRDVQVVGMVNAAAQATEVLAERIDIALQSTERHDKDIQAIVVSQSPMLRSYGALQQPSHHEVEPICHSPCIELQRGFADLGASIQRPIRFTVRTNSNELVTRDQDNAIREQARASSEQREKTGYLGQIKAMFCCR